MNTSAQSHSKLSLARTLKMQQVVVFEKVVEVGSILAASTELAMTQSAVSKSIHELERHLGQALFVRSKRGVALTDFGSDFEQHAKSILAELRYLAEGLNDWRSGASGHVIVGTLITASATLLPEAIHRLRQGASDVSVEVRVGSIATLFPLLARGELDVVVGFLPHMASMHVGDADYARLSHVRLYQEALSVVVGAQHPLARRRKLTLRELSDLDWILPTSDSFAYESAIALFHAEGLALPQRVVHSVSILTNLGLLTGSQMVGLMPQSAALPFVEAGLISILPMGRLKPFCDVGYSVRADRPPTATAQRFLDALHEAGKKLQKMECA